MRKADRLRRLFGGEERSLESLLRFEGDELRNGGRSERFGEFSATLYRKKEDAQDVRRLLIGWPRGEVDLLPTKGLSIGSYTHENWSPFWEPVQPGLISPEAENLMGRVLINGEPHEAMRWIENFAGCVELLGFSNWGMPLHHSDNGEVLPLHGEASHIPVENVDIARDERYIAVSGGFELRLGWWRDPDESKPWYRRGEHGWRVTRTVLIDTQGPTLQFVDEIRNDAKESMVPDWGYHYQFRAEPGTKMVIPSKEVMGRFSENLEEDFQLWKPAAEAGTREERGYIHRGTVVEESPLGRLEGGRGGNYPSGPGTCFTMPAAGYPLSWFSCGGKGSLEFALPERPSESLIPVAWNGVGPEIGVSALDHDGNTDPAIEHPPVAPGRSIELYSKIAACENPELPTP